MSSLFLLRDAIGAIKDKAVSAAQTATSEDLAYISTALEKLGGNASIIEIEDFASSKKDALQATYDGLLSALGASVDDVSDTITGLVAATTTTVNALTASAIADVMEVKTTSQSVIATASSDALSQISAARAESLETIQSQINVSVKTLFLSQL
jgi:hypothetical protein